MRAFPVMALGLVACTAVAGCARTPGTGAVAAAAVPGGVQVQAQERCKELTAEAVRFGMEAVIASAILRQASGPTPPPPGSPPWVARTPAMPEHCEVVGRADERLGTDGQRYAIGFRLRLPTEWNGRFLFQGGGGTDGNVGDAVVVVSPGAPTALDRGFAVVATDAGHDNRMNYDPTRQGQVAFGFDYQARVDYAERSLLVVTQLSRAIVHAFYGRAPERSYFFGCSNGGRQGMVLAQRFPEFYDGIVASAPGFDLPRAAIAQAWDTQVFAELARRMDLLDERGTPLLNRTFSDGDLALVSEAALEACDAADGLADGMIGDFMACTTERIAPALAARTCADAKTEGCLTREQVEALKRVHAGPRNSAGESLYSDWPWDAGIGGRVGSTYHSGWRIWKLGMYGGEPLPFPINVVLGSPAMSALFTTPPTPVPDDPRAHLEYQLRFSMDTDAPKIHARTAEFPRSSWELIAAKSTDLTAFRERGGKMIVPHGVSDPVFSIHDTTRWWEAVDAASGGRAADFVRVFAVPGMTHCSGGPATDRYDCLAAIVEWVERGAAPERIVAIAGEVTPWPNRARPLCPYAVARYTGTGSTEAAENFHCR